MPTATEHPVHMPAEGGCACGRLRYRMLRPPLFVHCCHCTRCQRETGGPFAHHAMLEWNALDLVQGEPAWTQQPTDSGARHWVLHCPDCRTVLWNEWGSRRAATRYLRVGTLDEPDRWPPQAHIFVRSKQGWVLLDSAVPAFEEGYDARRLWPPASLQRRAAALQERNRLPDESAPQPEEGS